MERVKVVIAKVARNKLQKESPAATGVAAGFVESHFPKS